MRVSDKAIVLQSVKYGDKKLMLKLYSRHHGLMSAAVVVSQSASAKIKPAAVLPLNLLQVELIKKQNSEVQRLTEASCYYIHTGIAASMSKLSIAQFLNELLIRCLKEQAPNANLYDFIEGCLKYLNESEEHVNLHLYFLIELSKYLGIEPHNNFTDNDCYFDCREGRFSSLALSFPLGLDREESRFFSNTLQTGCLQLSLTHAQRQKLLEILMAYYQLHVPGFTTLKSLSVLREVAAS